MRTIAQSAAFKDVEIIGATAPHSPQMIIDPDALAAARREFGEETSLDIPAGEPWPLGEVTQRGGKRVTAWALEGDLDLTGASSNTFEIEWPRGSGRMAEFPEVDRVEWMPLERASTKILPAQAPFLERLLQAVTAGRPERPPGGSPP